MKTGALLRFGCVAGAILGQADAAKWNALDRYGSVLGEAFQIADDLLDLEGDPATVGKATGKDAAANKATLVGVLGPARGEAPAGGAGGGGGGGARAVRQFRRRAQGRGPLRRDPQRVRSGSGAAMRGRRRTRRGEWYSWVGSNHRPPVPQTGALTI